MKPLIDRSERIEQAAWESLYEGAPAPLRQGMGLEVVRASTGMRLSAGRVDHLLLNRSVGFRPTVDPLDGAVDDVLTYFRRAGVGRFWVQLGSDQRHGPIPSLLASRGITRYPRSWMKFVRDARPASSSRNDSPTRAARADDTPAIARLFECGFDLPPMGGSLLASGVDRDRWHYLVVADAGEPVAAAALFVFDGDGYLAFAATDPNARRRGLQRNLMAARLDLAASLGCRRVFTETGLPVAGESNSSYRNMLRLGFDELCVRDNFAPEGTAWRTLPSSDVDTKSSVLPGR